MHRRRVRSRDRTHARPAPKAGRRPEGPVLPKSTRKLVDVENPVVSLGKRHAGLQLDKLSSAGEMENQKTALGHVTRTLRDQELRKSLFACRGSMLEKLGAARLWMTTRGSLTLHLSRSGALENAGIALHPVYGFAYLPGSGIKGLVRAWAETVWAPAQADKEKAWRRIEEAFGWSPRSEDHKFPQPKKGRSGWRPKEIQPRDGASAGRLVFHDAWPTCWPRLILDVVNNHHVRYYAGEDDPGGWEDPTLVYFLAVGGGETFEFALSDRKSGDDGLLDLARDWLRDALAAEGAGAKTAAGYGRFKPAEGEDSVTASPDLAKAGFRSANFDLKLVTPAFLAGADQRETDCDLRPATLRGLLRWWWRTMHAAHLDRKSIKRLETAVWGDAESGSPVRIAVDLVEGKTPVHYEKKDGFRKKNDLRAPPNKKTTQGLFYVSYGMDDGRKGDRKRRWYRPAGTRWSVRIAARRGWLSSGGDGARKTEIAPEALLTQAVAALWLLCRFGGVGSKARKGFGSFEDIEVKGIASVKDCKRIAQDFRNQYFRKGCQLSGQVNETRSPSLEKMKFLEVSTPWRNSWTALDQLGYVVQAFARQRAHEEEKKALGLPRKIHGPMKHPMKHQDRAKHKPPKELSAEKGRRHAAPVHYHLARSDDDKLLIRATAFPAHHLPSLRESETMLGKLLKSLDEELSKRAKEERNIGQREHVELPQANDRVEAELLEEKTKKGGWKAKHPDSGLDGPIQDTGNVPTDAKPGQRVTLTVAYATPQEIAFRWAPPKAPKKNPNPRDRQRRNQRGRR